MIDHLFVLDLEGVERCTSAIHAYQAEHQLPLVNDTDDEDDDDEERIYVIVSGVGRFIADQVDVMVAFHSAAINLARVKRAMEWVLSLPDISGLEIPTGYEEFIVDSKVCSFLVKIGDLLHRLTVICL